MTLDTTGSHLDEVLERTFSVQVPSGARAVIGRRVDVAIAAETARRDRTIRGRGLATPVRRLLIGLAAAFLLSGTVAAGGTLFSQLIGGAPLLEDVWDRSTEISRSTTDAGYMVSLERAAADADRVWVAISVTAASGTEADVGRMRISDANGMILEAGTGGAIASRGVTASLFGFQVPDGLTPEGPFRLEVTSVISASGETQGQWAFTFDAPLTSAPDLMPLEPTPTPDTP